MEADIEILVTPMPPGIGEVAVTRMRFTKADINAAIAQAMGETVGDDFVDGHGEAHKRFIGWAEPLLNEDAAYTYELLRPSCGDVPALVSALKIMDRHNGWTCSQSIHRGSHLKTV